MATMITNDCINCGACEPECPNNAISQGETIFVIDPKLCTECVGFHDYEACAAVCPVDCCVTDPNNIETEAALLARARTLHPDTQFDDNFESRFRKGQGQSVTAGAKQSAPARSTAANAGGDSVGAAMPANPSAAPSYADQEIRFVPLPDIDSWEIPVRCFKCNRTHVEPVRNFMIGNVIFCPHCNKSMAVRDNLNFHVRSLLKDAYDRWQTEQNAFQANREREFREFIECLTKEAEAFEAHQQRELQKIRQQLETLGETYDAAGKPIKRGSRFGWG